MTSISFPRHGPIRAFDVSGNDLVIGEIPLTRLAARVGRTPFYAYDRGAIDERVATLRAALPTEIRIHYAMKANPMPAVVGYLASRTDGIDVASAQEMHIALSAGVPPWEVSFAGPGKSQSELTQALAAGITINLESILQYEMAVSQAEVLGVDPRLAIRVNPSFELKSSGMRMGGGAKPFGVDEEQVPSLLARMKNEGVAPVGLHIYGGSQNLNADAIAQAQQRSVALACRLAGRLDCRLEWLNIGGGFGVPYFPGELPLQLGPIGATLDGLCQQARAELDAPLALELGRYLVAEAGVYVTRVIDCKVSQGQTFVVVDGGLNHNLAATGNFGQVIRKNYPVAVGNRLNEKATLVQSVVGPLCTPLDLLADRVELPKAQVGDLIVVFMAGAYGLSASPLAFLSHPAPAEVLI